MLDSKQNCDAGCGPFCLFLQNCRVLGYGKTWRYKQEDTEAESVQSDDRIYYIELHRNSGVRVVFSLTREAFSFAQFILHTAKNWSALNTKR